MHIGMFVRHFWPTKLTSLPRTVYELSKRFVKNGNRVTIITNSRDTNQENTQFLEKNLNLSYVEKFKKQDFDLLHFFGSSLGGLLFLKEARKCGKPVILNLYTHKKQLFKDLHPVNSKELVFDRRILPFLLKNLVITFMPNFLLKQKLTSAEKIIIQSYRDLLFYSKLVHNKVVRVPHGIDFRKFSGDNKNSNHLKKTLGFNENDKIILYLGHAYSSRGIEELFYSVKKIKNKVSNIKLLLVLNKMPHSTFDRMEKQVMTQNFVTLIYRYVAKPEDYYKLADIVALPYRSSLEIPEYPSGLLEAMASGTPIITTNVGAIPEIVKNHYSGLLIPPRKQEQLKNSITQILENSDLSLKLAKNAQQTVKNFDWNIVATKIFEIYKEATLN